MANGADVETTLGESFGNPLADEGTVKSIGTKVPRRRSFTQ